MGQIEVRKDRPAVASSSAPVPLTTRWRQEKDARAEYRAGELAHVVKRAEIEREAERRESAVRHAAQIVFTAGQAVDGLAQYRESVFAAAGESLRSKDVDDCLTRGMQAITDIAVDGVRRLAR